MSGWKGAAALIRTRPVLPIPDGIQLGTVGVGSGRNRARIGNRRGQSFVEFTLVIPLLLLIMTGMLSFGFALHNYIVLANAVTAGAEILAVSRGQTSDPCATAYAAVNSAALGLTTANLTMRFTINGTLYTSSSCTSGTTNMVQGASAEVQGIYPCTLGVFGMKFSTCNLMTQTVELIQ